MPNTTTVRNRRKIFAALRVHKGFTIEEIVERVGSNYNATNPAYSIGKILGNDEKEGLVILDEDGKYYLPRKRRETSEDSRGSEYEPIVNTQELEEVTLETANHTERVKPGLSSNDLLGPDLNFTFIKTPGHAPKSKKLVVGYKHGLRIVENELPIGVDATICLGPECPDDWGNKRVYRIDKAEYVYALNEKGEGKKYYSSEGVIYILLSS